MTPPPVAITPARPMLAMLRLHILVECEYAGDARRCTECRWLQADASAETWEQSTARRARAAGVGS